MKRSVLLPLVFASMLISFINPLASQSAVNAAQTNVPSSWQKGVSINATNPEDFASSNFQKSVQNLAQTHVNYVTLIIQTYQTNINSTDIFPGQQTTSDAALISGINYIHSLGLNVMLKFHTDPLDGDWRANINPTDRSAWFTSYTAMLTHFAGIAQQTKVEQLCLGTEMTDMASALVNPTNTQYWITLIKNVRSVYSGALIYNANDGSEAMNVGFWSYLDNIGISAYLQLSNTPDASVATLENGWANNFADILVLHTKFNKNVLFSEVGYRSISGANESAWAWSTPGTPDQVEQANDYTALFDFWSKYNWMIGVHLWYWNTDPNSGGASDTSYTPQGKLAQAVLTQWFGNGQQVAPNFNVTQVSSPSQPLSINQTASLSVSVQNIGGTTINGNSDIEIYNSQNVQVYQKVFTWQTFNGNSIQTYGINWIPTYADTYTMKIGIFNGSWSQNYYWNNNAQQLKAGIILQPISIWWPTNGSIVSGMQPFKAVIQGTSLAAYSMYWQIDNGTLNTMINSNNPDHKESDVNVSNWKAGSHVLSFIAKDMSGNVIGTQAVTIISK